MKLSKPEDMDEMEETSGKQAKAVKSGMVRLFDEVMAVSEAVGLLGDVVEEPGSYGIAESENVEKLRERVEQQEKAIAELADAVEILAQNQGAMMEQDEGAGPSVFLESDRLDGIYDPVEESEDGK